jgi:hypothetical protein
VTLTGRQAHGFAWYRRPPLPRRIPGATLRRTPGPRPAPPKQRLTARPLSRDLDPYRVTAPVSATPAPAPRTTWEPPGPLLARDLYDAHHADQAFGGDAPAAPDAVSPFGPVRKREQAPKPTVPGQRKQSESLVRS